MLLLNNWHKCNIYRFNLFLCSGVKLPQNIFNVLYKIMVSCVLAISSASENFSYLAILSASYKLGINLTFKCL